ncbi:rRNA methyltransferase [Francisella tularensis subsp. holarctica]|nr:rRNA methyltransferase [Francisella tularensis subsp. holarctica]
MIAILLDIITFLQISFSTNIFRINYILIDVAKK